VRAAGALAGDLVVSAVTVAYGRGTALCEVALRDVSLRVAQGDWTVIVGHNGAGKSSLLRAISGSAPVESGLISVGGLELRRLPRSARARAIGVVSDHPEFNTASALTVEEHLALALSRGARRLRPALSVKRKGEIRVLVRKAGLGLDRRLSTPVGALSAGQRQAVALLMALATHPALLLLDEYTANLDPWTAERLRSATRALTQEAGTTVIATTHDVEEALGVADRLVVMRRGTIAADHDLRGAGTTRELLFRLVGLPLRDGAAGAAGTAAPEAWRAEGPP
jgi:putative ABC transport system ATP-binding protein